MLQLRNATTNKGPLWLVEKKYTIGSDSACDIKISDSTVGSQHAELHVDGDNLVLVSLADAGNIVVNGKVVKGKVALKPGDHVSIGSNSLEILDPKASKAPLSAAPKAPEGWALKALNTALADKHFPMVGSQVIGRSGECDVSLGVVHLSRKHARVTVTDQGLVVEDLNSSNGTFVNGKKVSKATVVAGDELSFDTLRFRVIGPVVDDDKTTVRPAADGELTTIRPALNIPVSPAAAPKAAASPAAKPIAPARPKPVRPSAAPVAAEAPAVESSGKSGGLVVVLAVVVIGLGAAAAWYLLK